MKHIKPLATILLFALSSCNAEAKSTLSSSDKLSVLEILKRDMASSNCALDFHFCRYPDLVHFEMRMEFNSNAIKCSNEEQVAYYILEDHCVRYVTGYDDEYRYTSDSMQYDSDTLSPYAVFPVTCMSYCASGNPTIDFFAHLTDDDLSQNEDGRIHMPDIVIHPFYPGAGGIINYDDENAVIRYKDVYFTIKDEHVTSFECNLRLVSLSIVGGDRVIVPDSEDAGLITMRFLDYGHADFELPNDIQS